MQGWIKFHRKILDNEIWHDVTAFRLFTLLLLKASHKDGVKVRGIEINRGQYLRSYSKLSEDLEYMEGRSRKKIPKSTIERKVKKLVDEEMVSVSETVSGTLFTILKYDSYQGFEDEPKPDCGTDIETIAGQTRDGSGTDAGQEQELKNLRTKELKELNTTTAEQPAPDSTSADDFQKRLLSRFVELRAYGFTHSPKDELAAAEIKQAGVPIETAIKTMEEVFANYQPRHSRDRINALSYCVGPILDKHIPSAAMPATPGNYQPRSNYRNKPVREELLPEWFNQPEDDRVPETVPPTNDNLEAEKQKVLARLEAKKAARQTEE